MLVDLCFMLNVEHYLQIIVYGNNYQIKGIVMNNICMDVHNQKTLRIPSHDYTMLCNSHIEGF